MRKNALAGSLLILLLGSIAYSNSLTGAFIFDDETHILFNPDIRSLWPLSRSFFSYHHAARPLIGFSFALNYAISGFETWSYHLVNLIIHLLSALCVFGIVRRLCLSQNSAKVPTENPAQNPPRTMAERFGAIATPIAFSTAALWVVHPLNTEAVSYITQRFQSGMGLFYLLTLYLSVRVIEADPLESRLWKILAILACALGMGCKQDMVTAPVLVILCDVLFYSGDISRAWKLRSRFYFGLLSTELVLIGLQWMAPPIEWAGLRGLPLTPLIYAMNQTAIVAHYLWLAIWPIHLTFDFWWIPAREIQGVMPQGLSLVLLLSFCLWKARKSRLFGFFCASLLCTLGVTSSFLPIADLACEYRMYLPLVVLLAFGSGVIWERSLRLGKVWGRPLASSLIFVGVTLLAILTYQRNEAYASALALWGDVVQVQPKNPRAWNNLGIAYENAGQLEDARKSYRKAIEVGPTFSGALDSLARMALKDGHVNEAIERLHEAIRVVPNYSLWHAHLATALNIQGNFKEAIQQGQKAIELEPDMVDAYFQLGMAYSKLGDTANASRAYQETLRLNPEYREALTELQKLKSH